jgi:hypothetical protein
MQIPDVPPDTEAFFKLHLIDDFAGRTRVSDDRRVGLLVDGREVGVATDEGVYKAPAGAHDFCATLDGKTFCTRATLLSPGYVNPLPVADYANHVVITIK